MRSTRMFFSWLAPAALAASLLAAAPALAGQAPPPPASVTILEVTRWSCEAGKLNQASIRMTPGEAVRARWGLINTRTGQQVDSGPQPFTAPLRRVVIKDALPPGTADKDVLLMYVQLTSLDGAQVYAADQVSYGCDSGAVRPWPPADPADPQPFLAVVGPVSDPELAAYRRTPLNGVRACGAFAVDWWGIKLVHPANFPICAGYGIDQVTVACWDGEGWSTANVEEWLSGGYLQARISQHGTCGVFRK